MTSSRRHSAKGLSKTFDNSVVAIVTDLSLFIHVTVLHRPTGKQKLYFMENLTCFKNTFSYLLPVI